MATINQAFTITHQTRPCWVDGRRAIFHRWTDSARPVKPRGMEEDEAADRYQLHSVHALVEYEDGTVERVWPNTVRFADSRELFDGLAWEEMEARRDALPFEYSQDVAEAANQATPRTCITCGYDRILESHCINIDYRCDRCDETACRCKDCQDANKWIPKGGTA
jgi:hypothetical protein